MSGEENISRRYARALFGLAVEKSDAAVDEFGQELDAFDGACKTQPALTDTLANRFFDLFARDRIIDALSAKIGLSPEVRNFLKLLGHKGRTALFPRIREDYHGMANAHMKREVMTVVSAVDLPENIYTGLREIFARMTGKTMIVRRRLLPSVIGGARVHVRNKVYDYTVRNQLERLQRRLLA